MTALLEIPRTRFAASAFAPAPAEWRGVPRDQVRMLVGTPDRIDHARFNELPDFLGPGDVLVVNTSATVPGQMDATLNGRPVVAHLAHHLDDGSRVLEIRTAPDADRAVLDAAPGDRLRLGDVTLMLAEPWPGGRPSSPTGEGNRLWRVTVDGDLDSALEQNGRPITYGYLDRPYPLEAYQTVFAKTPGSAEMASASRPFTSDVVARLVSAGVVFAPVVLHTGFSSQEAGEAPGPEWYGVPTTTAAVVNAARAEGGRVIAVGTTATRALESSVEDGKVVASLGWTERVVTPEHPPQIVDGLITGWHDPMASHLLLVESVAGADLTQRAYDAAVDRGYLWHEFGDSALLLGTSSRRPAQP